MEDFIQKLHEYIYLHCDWHKSHYLRMIMDEVFGIENFQRELVWQLHGVAGFKSKVNNYVRGHDTIFYYGYENRVFNKEYLPYDEKQLKRFSSVDSNGRRYKSITKDRVIYLDESSPCGRSSARYRSTRAGRMFLTTAFGSRATQHVGARSVSRPDVRKEKGGFGLLFFLQKK